MKILILSDGKAGHVNQSLGIADQLPKEYETDIYQLNYERGTKFTILCLIAVASRLPLAGRIAKAVFRLIEPRDLRARFAAGDVRAVLSTGTLAEPLNYLIGAVHGVKRVLCQKPNYLPFRAFDAVVMCSFQIHHPPANVLATLCTPNRVGREAMQLKADDLRRERDIPPGPYTVGVLVGGESKRHDFNPPYMEKLVETLNDFTTSVGGRYLLTTSRRTSKELERAIEEHIDPALCPYMLLVSREPVNPVAAILGISDVTVVTDDSVSMLSECVSSGKYFIIIEAILKPGQRDKFMGLYKNLDTGGFAHRCKIDDLPAALREAYANPRPLHETRVSRQAAEFIAAVLAK